MKLFRRILPAVLALGASAFTFSLASAAEAGGYLAAESFVGKKVRVDGMLREWPRGFDKLSVQARGSGGKGEALVGYDAKYVYLAAKVADDKIVRTAGAGRGEDRLTLDIWIPAASGKGGSSHTISVYPGDPGKLPGVVKIDGSKAAGAKAVEAPNSKGLIIEAQIPWSAIAGTDKVRVGMRGKLSYHDARAVGSVRAVTSTSSATGAKMPPLTLAAETGLIQALIEPKQLGLTPAREAYGDVTGKGGVERVAVYGHFLSIVGPGYKGGKQFYYNELDVGSADRVRRLELRDMSGDGVAEIVMVKRIGKDDEYREVLQIMQIARDGAPLQVFAHEITLVTPEGSVQNEVKFAGSGSGATVEIAQGPAKGFDPGSFREPTIGGGIKPALLPWQTVGARVFGWKDSGLAQVDERSWKPTMIKATAAPAVKAPPAPRPPSADELLDRVYGLYKQDRGVGNHAPRFDFVTDVVEDEQMERVLVHDRDLVVFGKGFKKGLSYTYLTIGVKDTKDILSVTTRDLVGDSKAEILVHAVLEAQASEELGGEVVQRQALFVYKVIGDQMQRIFAAETGRALQGNRILGSVAFVPAGSGVTLELRPLQAVGWTDRTYPFPEDSGPAGGLEPLLLPWTSMSSRRYVFDGSNYALQ